MLLTILAFSWEDYEMKNGLPIINTMEDCNRLFPNTLIISNYDTYEKFDELYFHIYDCACATYKKPLCKGFQIKFKFYSDDEKTFSLSIPKLLMNMNAWRPLIELKSIENYYINKIKVLNEGFIVGIMMNQRTRMGLESKVLNTLIEYGITFETYSGLIKTVIERYQQISLEFTALDSSAIMTFESIFLNDYRTNEKVRELNNTKISENLQTSEVEKLLKQKTKELIAAFEVTKNPIWYISKAGNHIKEKQVQELFISYGQIPDVTGHVIPYTMKGNGFSTGYIDPTTYYIAATGSNLSAIMNKSYMGEAGYLARNLILMSRTLTLSKTLYDCGTKHLVQYYVKDSQFLHALENKWATETLGGKLELIHYETHKHWIGKKIWIRSIVTCAGGDECCHVCYGADSHLVANMPGMSIFNTEVFSEPVSQNILSTKHLLFTNANELKFGGEFHTYFKYISGDLYIKGREEMRSDINMDRLSIRIEEQNLIPVNKNDMIEHSSFGNNVISPIWIYDSKTKEYHEVVIENYESMFIDADSVRLFKLITDKKNGKSYYDMSFDAVSSELDGRLLSIDVKNNGLTDNLHAIMKLLNDNASKYDDYNELSQYFLEMLLSSGINCRSVQSEIIINRLIRDANDIYQRPDFSKFKVPEYTILKLNKALHMTKAPTIGLSYQETKRQILGDALYEEKDGSSYLDPFYANKVSTKNLKALAHLVLERKEKNNNGRTEE